MGDTFLVTEGKVKTDLERLAEELRFAVEEGYSDQTIMHHADMVSFEIEKLKGRLKEVL